MNKPIRTVPTEWQEVILVCGKCSKKLGGGFGPHGDKRLDKALGLKKGRKAPVQFVRVSCFDICPKNAVTVAKTSEPGRLHLIPRGMPADEIAVELGLEGKDILMLGGAG